MLRAIGIGVLVIALCGVFAFLQLFPVIPTSLKGWLAFFFLGVPFWALAEGAGEWFWSKRRFEGWSSGQRIMVGVVAMLGMLALLYYPWKLITELIQS